MKYYIIVRITSSNVIYFNNILVWLLDTQQSFKTRLYIENYIPERVLQRTLM